MYYTILTIDYKGDTCTVTAVPDGPGGKVKILFDDTKVELLESDPEERMATYKAHGSDEAGNTYIATAEFICDDLHDLMHIEKSEH